MDLIKKLPHILFDIKKLLLLWCILLFQLISYSQQTKIDSIFRLLNTQTNDSVKLLHLYHLTDAVADVNPDSCIVIAEKTALLVQKFIASQNQEGTGKFTILNAEASAYSIFGTCYLAQTDFNKAVFNYKKSIQQYEALHNSISNHKERIRLDSLIASRLLSIGVIYLNLGNYPTAQEYYFKSMKLRDEIGDKRGIADLYSNIGSLYNYQSDYKKALDYLNKSLRMQEQIGNKMGIAMALGNIGIVYSDQKDNYRALDYYIRSLAIIERLGDKRGIATSLLNIGVTYTDIKQYKKALEFFMRALTLCEETNDKNGIAIAYNSIGEFYANTGDNKNAEKYLLDALKIDIEIGAQDLQRQTELSLSTLFSETNRYQQALEHYKKAVELKDAMFDNEKNKQLARREIGFEFEKKQAKIKADQDKKDAINYKEKQKQKIITYFISTCLLLVILLAIFIFRGYRNKQKANIIITQQKEEVEKKNWIIEEQKKIVVAKNKDIMDSINYAKSIQIARLPNKEEILQLFPDSFVLFKPKDVVSGDFYFVHSYKSDVLNPNQFFIGVADGTGHGVPGAFMSMIGSERLDDAFSQSSDTSEILSKLNVGIKNSLRQSEGNQSSFDGMDIAICSVRYEVPARENSSIILKFAGANRPLWLLRKDKTSIEEFDGTKMAIAGYTSDDQYFNTHEVSLMKGDCFYIFTDGFADQFGGPNDKKLMTKRMKEILVSIQHLSMQEQEKFLIDFMEDWKKDTEQVDDMLVIGVRV